eukprot:CAMPEP_0116550934 /NCGR_PEP_ID=MMETSP0397-20121206/5691_1 /TAXON_ID=216820 /ORGANISM="Cyclophora tenuis, Strain ECT3854" /LENGTH=78 /DNA_ID=CAMNT_0004075797 /DNA_START=58 /DNA_END=291 /DNA_ORIENTATION=-
MGLGSVLVGGFSGLSIQFMSNAIRKVPLSREPWNHVGMFILGCWAGNQYCKVEEQLVDDINELRAERGMPPMIVTKGW